MSRTRRIRIRGHWWRVIRKRPPSKETYEGLCDYVTRTIYLNPKAADQAGTLIHEVLHAAFPDLDEPAVGEAEEAIVTALALL